MAVKFTLATLFSAVDGISGPAKTMEKNVSHMAEHSSRAMSALKNVVAGALAAFTVGEAIHQITEFADKADEISRTSRALGVSAENLQKLRYAAKMTDVPTEALTTAFRKMNVNLGELHTRQGALYERLKRTNPALAVQLYNTRDSGKAFNVLVDAIKHTGNAQERAALAQAAFGRGGQELLPLIMKGTVEIGKMGDQAERLGLVMSEETAAAGEKLHQSLLHISAVGQGILNRVLGKIVEKLAPIVDKISDWVMANQGLINQKIDQVFTAIGNAITIVADIWKTLNDLAGGHLARDILLIAAAWKAVAIAIAVAEVAQKAFNLLSGKGAADAAASAAKTAAGALTGGGGAVAGVGGAGAIAALAAPLAAGLAMIALTTAVQNHLEKTMTPEEKNQRDMLNPYRFQQLQNASLYVHAAPGTGGVSQKSGGTPAPSLTLPLGWAATK
jgi:hypothetical protein